MGLMSNTAVGIKTIPWLLLGLQKHNTTVGYESLLMNHMTTMV